MAIGGEMLVATSSRGIGDEVVAQAVSHMAAKITQIELVLKRFRMSFISITLCILLGVGLCEVSPWRHATHPRSAAKGPSLPRHDHSKWLNGEVKPCNLDIKAF